MKKLISSLLTSFIMLAFGIIKPGVVPGSPPGMLHKSYYEKEVQQFIVKSMAVNRQQLLQLENLVLKLYLDNFVACQKQYNKSYTISLINNAGPLFRKYKRLIFILKQKDALRDNMKSEAKCHKIFLKYMRKLKQSYARPDYSAKL